jgi:hypothetical protein
MTDPFESSPVVVLTFTAVPETTTFEASSAVTVIVVVLELSDLTVAGKADNCKVAAVGVVGVVEVPEPPVLSLQPASSAIEATNKTDTNNWIGF